VKLVLTLLTRDQADVVDALVSFHLNAGVDFVIAMDHRSGDGTAEILEAYEREGVLHLIRQTSSELRTREWRTGMARLAATEYAADWVIGCDGDEFWWPRGGSLKDVLAAVPDAYGIVDAPWRFFLPRSNGPSFFAERMTVRLSPLAALLHPQSPFKPRVKIAHRADPAVIVQGGNHSLLEGPFELLRGWHPIEVLHFPIRLFEQYKRTQEQWRRSGRTPMPVRGGLAIPEDAFTSLAIDEEKLARGLETGGLTLDTRLRDALRMLRLPDVPAGPGDTSRRGFRLPGEDTTPGFPAPTIENDREYASDLAALADSGLANLRRRVDELGARISAREPTTR
jgi:glycosyl transferase family 2